MTQKPSHRPPDALSSLDDVAAQEIFAECHGADEAHHGDQECRLEVQRAAQMDPEQDQQGDRIDVQRVERQDAVRLVRPFEQTPEAQQQRPETSAKAIETAMLSMARRPL
jgi:hypothetical protein